MKKPVYNLSINKTYINKPNNFVMTRAAHHWEKFSLDRERFILEIRAGHAFAPQFVNNRVIKKDFVSSNYIALDIDNNMRLEEALENPFITSNCDFIYTTASHTEAHHKFRILFVTEESWTSIDAYEMAIKRLMAKVGCVDESTKNANRLFYGSTSAVFYKYRNQISPSLLADLNAPIEAKTLRPNDKMYLRDNLALKLAMFQIPAGIKEERDDLVRLALFAEVNIGRGVGQDLYIEKWHNGQNSRTDIQGSMRSWYEQHDAIVPLARIKQILKKFGVDYTYSLYPMDFPRLQVCEKYLSMATLEAAMTGKKLVAIRSPMGTGKTTFLRHYLEDKAFDFVAHRVSLVNKIAHDFGAVSYRDQDYYQNTLGQEITRFVSTFHSYERTNSAPKDILVIDEVHQGLHTLSTEQLLRLNRKSTVRFFISQLKASSQIIILDAHLMDEDVAAIAEMAGVAPEDTLVIENTYKPDRGVCHFYETKTPMPVIEALKTALENKERCYLSCVSKRAAKSTAVLINELDVITAEDILKFIDHKRYKVLMINSETTATRQVMEFMMDPVTQSKYYNLIIATPSIGSGISIEGPIFDKVFHIGAGDIIALTDQLQMPSRVRDCRERLMWIEARKPRSKLTDDCLIYSLVVENAIQSYSPNIIEENGVKKLKPIDATIAKIRAYHQAKNTIHQYNSRSKAKQYLLEDGWALDIIQDETKAIELKSVYDKVKKYLRLENLDKIFAADDIDAYKAIELETIKLHEESSIYALLRFKIKDALRVDPLTPLHIRQYISMKLQERIKFNETCTLDLETLNQLDDQEIQLTEVDKTFYIYRKTLLNNWLRTIGRSVDTILSSPFSYSEKTLDDFAAFAMKNSAVITQTLNLEVSQGFKPVQLFSRVLDKMGIKHRGKSAWDKGHVYKEYRSDPSEIGAILQRRKEIPSSFDALLHKIKTPVPVHELTELNEHGRLKKIAKNL